MKKRDISLSFSRGITLNRINNNQKLDSTCKYFQRAGYSYYYHHESNYLYHNNITNLFNKIISDKFQSTYDASESWVRIISSQNTEVVL